MYVVFLVLIYAFLMSFWWLIMKMIMNLKPADGSDKTYPNNLIRMVSGLFAGLLIVASVLKNGPESILNLKPEFWGWISGVVLLNIAIAFFYVKAMEKSVASIAVHVTLLGPTVAVFTAVLMGIDSWPSVTTFLGILAIPVGIYFLHFNPSQYGRNLVGPLKEIWTKRGNWLWYAVGLAFCAGFAIPMDAQAVRLSNSMLSPGITLFVAWGIVYGITAWIVGDFKTARKFQSPGLVSKLLLLGIVFGLAQIFQAEAYNYDLAAAVGSLKRLDAPFVVLWAFLFLPGQEKSEGRFFFRMTGSIIAVAGAVLIGLGK